VQNLFWFSIIIIKYSFAPFILLKRKTQVIIMAMLFVCVKSMLVISIILRFYVSTISFCITRYYIFLAIEQRLSFVDIHYFTYILISALF